MFSEKHFVKRRRDIIIVCLEFTNKESCSSNLFELNIMGIHTVSHLADQYSIHKVTDDVKKVFCYR